MSKGGWGQRSGGVYGIVGSWGVMGWWGGQGVVAMMS